MTQLIIICSVFIVLQVCLAYSQVSPSHPQFGAKEEVNNEAHIKQHMENKINVEHMTDEQRRFYYFSMSDLDKDGKIDGTEILKALTHDHEHDTGPGAAVVDEENLITMIDNVLADMDLNDDGFIDYAEYSRKRGN